MGPADGLARVTATRITLGRPTSDSREETFLDGRLVVVSRNGLHAQERALLSILPRNATGRALVVQSDRAFLGLALRALNPGLEVVCAFDDAWDAAAARETIAAHDASLAPRVVLSPDPPDGEFDLVVAPFTRRGVADEARERIRGSFHRLCVGGRFLASSDDKGECFVLEEVRRAFGDVGIHRESLRKGGVAYTGKRTGAPRVNAPSSDATFVVAEADERLEFVTRLGMFCHGRLDPGTRVLLAEMQVGGAANILDLGCGCGVVGIVAARRAPAARVAFLDSAARAVQCAQRNAAAHGIGDRCTFVLTAEPARDLDGHYDLVLSNPPYYGNWRIARQFLDAAAQSLAPGGRIELVTKGIDWYREAMAERFVGVEEVESGGYWVLRGRN